MLAWNEFWRVRDWIPWDSHYGVNLMVSYVGRMIRQIDYNNAMYCSRNSSSLWAESFERSNSCRSNIYDVVFGLQ